MCRKPCGAFATGVPAAELAGVTGFEMVPRPSCSRCALEVQGVCAASEVILAGTVVSLMLENKPPMRRAGPALRCAPCPRDRLHALCAGLTC